MLAKLEAFPEELGAREVIAARCTVRLEEIVETVVVPEGYRSTWAQFSIMMDRRDQLCASLGHESIPVAIYSPQPLHLQLALTDIGYAAGDLPIANLVSRRILSLPMHPDVDQETQPRTIDAVCDEIGC